MQTVREPEQRVTVVAVGKKLRNRVTIGGEEVDLYQSSLSLLFR
jgi:hypothetical protein